MGSRQAQYRLLLLCTGNTCRSPLAAAAFQEELGADAGKVELVSAGTAALFALAFVMPRRMLPPSLILAVSGFIAVLLGFVVS